MKKLIATAFVLLACVLMAHATTIPPVPLKQRVLGANEVFIGRATRLDVLDDAGNVLNPVPDATHMNFTIRLVVVPTTFLRTSLKQVPAAFAVSYGRLFHLGVQSERDRLLGKDLVYLLNCRATECGESGLEFAEPLTNEAQIRTYLGQ